MQQNLNSQIVGFNMDYDEKSKEERRKLCIQPLLNNFQKLNINNFQIISSIGKGSFSNVYKIKDKNTSKIYAAKVFYLYKNDYTNNDFSKADRHLNILSQISHPCIAKSFGYTPKDFTNENNPMIITEYYKNGSLKNILDSVRKGQNLSFWTNETKQIIAYGIASAISYLHSNDIIHRDLKPDNILINDSYSPIICDFECARRFYKTTNEENDTFVGTPLYMAPENWNGFVYTEKSDVYAFGLILYEIFVGRLPFSKLDSIQICYQVAIKKETPKIDKQIPKLYKEIIESCLEYDPDKRPTFSEIINKLNAKKEFNKNTPIDSLIDQIRNLNEQLKVITKTKLVKSCILIGTTGEGKSTLASVFKATKTDNQISSCINIQKFGDSYLIDNEKEIKRFIQNLNIKELDLNKFERVSEIGSGGFGNVFLIKNKFTKKKYAAKELLTNKNRIIDFLHELKINSEINNNLITKLIGYSLHNFDNEPSMIIITEYIVNGSLERILQNERNHIKTKFWTGTIKLINIYRIASAILYLHSQGILHLDIKPSNVLIDEYLHAKVCDFSISLKIESDQLINTEIIGTFSFIPPEIIQHPNSKRTTKSDVYSFGMLLYEMITNHYPFQDYTPAQIIYAVTHGQRPKIDNSVPEVYKELIKLCWDDDPNKRPSFEYIVNELKNNKEFITDDVDESLYHSYIEILENDIKMKNSREQISCLFKTHNLDNIYENIQYGISESNTSESSCCTSESSCCTCNSDDKETHIRNDLNLKIKEIKDDYRMKYNSYSLSNYYSLKEKIINQTSQMKEISKQQHQTNSYFFIKEFAKSEISFE